MLTIVSHILISAMDDNDFHYRDATFQTGIDSYIPTDNESLRLPDVVNFVALRETCLSEAPFVNRSNRKFWKKWMDSSQYVTILCATLKILNDCISESGTVDAQGMYEIQGNPLMEQMSMCIAEMLVMERKRFSRSHDTLFIKLPELLCYMLVNSLHSCNPRQSRVFNSVKFRELLLDWLSELIGGIRMTNCQSERQWLFTDTIDTPISFHNSSFLTTLIPKPQARFTSKPSRTNLLRTSGTHSRITLPSLEEVDRNTPGKAFTPHSTVAPSAAAGSTANTNPAAAATATNTQFNATFLAPGSRSSGMNTTNKGGSTCHFSMGNSPLVNIYMNLGRTTDVHPYTCAHPVKLVLTTLPDRPLTSMTPDCLLKAGTFRDKIMSPDRFADSLKSSSTNRKSILKQLDVQRQTLKRETRRADQMLRIQYALLENKPVDTKKHILAASSATVDNSKYTGSTGSVGTTAD